MSDLVIFLVILGMMCLGGIVSIFIHKKLIDGTNGDAYRRKEIMDMSTITTAMIIILFLGFSYLFLKFLLKAI